MLAMASKFAALFLWAMGAWLLLTWSTEPEQIVAGGTLAALTALSMLSFGVVARPWRLLNPRLLLATLRLVAEGLVRIVRANLSLARRIWSPRLPLASGMVIVPTTMDTEGGLAGVGLITSLIVDNQIVDIDVEDRVLQYHVVSAPQGGVDERVAQINGPVERLVRPLVRRPQ